MSTEEDSGTTQPRVVRPTALPHLSRRYSALYLVMGIRPGQPGMAFLGFGPLRPCLHGTGSCTGRALLARVAAGEAQARHEVTASRIVLGRPGHSLAPYSHRHRHAENAEPRERSQYSGRGLTS